MALLMMTCCWILVFASFNFFSLASCTLILSLILANVFSSFRLSSGDSLEFLSLFSRSSFKVTDKSGITPKYSEYFSLYKYKPPELSSIYTAELMMSDNLKDSKLGMKT